MFVCIWYGTPREKVNIALLRHLDWPGLVYSGLGFALLYAGLDQGNRLDWVNNGLVNGLLMSGALLTLAFVMRELVVERPFLNLRLLAREGIVPILLVLAGFRFIILSTAYIIPTYLQVVQDYRELQVGAVLAVDCAAAVSDRSSSRLASFPRRGALGPCARRGLDRGRVSHGDRSHAGLGDR